MATEKRLIYARDLWSDIMMLPHNGDMISSEDVEQAIKEAETVDTVEVVHGRWKQARYTEAPLYICSECDKPEYKQHRYCPNCGAKMDGERRTDVN